MLNNLHYTKQTYCSNCLYPLVAKNLTIEDDGICSACHSHNYLLDDEQDESFWERKKASFLKKVESVHAKNPNRNTDYDCIVPVSGGKDSYYQTHIALSMGLNPLLVTYHGNNYLPEGDKNRDNMKNAFNVDHVVFSPSTDTLIRLNRLGFRLLGDMNWHAHCGITTLPHVLAVKFQIPLVLWGETPWHISGMYFHDDEAEFSYQNRHDHDCRGKEWYDFIDHAEDSISSKNLWWLKYPSNDDIDTSGLTGVHIGNYFPWRPREHTQLVIDKYGFTPAHARFERTYRTFSNLDDRYENGAHDLLKYIKFGYGRCSDHVGLDIRARLMTRAEGLELVKKHDHVIPSDLDYWLDYVSMSSEEFWRTADTFRSPEVWTLNDSNWVKDSPWGEPVIDPVRY